MRNKKKKRLLWSINRPIYHNHRLLGWWMQPASTLDIVQVPPFLQETWGKGIGADGVRSAVKNVNWNQSTLFFCFFYVSNLLFWKKEGTKINFYCLCSCFKELHSTSHLWWRHQQGHFKLDFLTDAPLKKHVMGFGSLRNLKEDMILCCIMGVVGALP